MDRRLRKIYVWSFMIVAGIVLALLYTPMGGRLYYSSNGSAVKTTYPGVNFQEKIVNPRGSSVPYSSGSTQSDLNIGQNNTLPSSGFSLSGSDISQNISRNYSSGGAKLPESSRAFTTTNSENQGSGVVGLIASRTRNSGISESGDASNYGSLTENIDLTSNNTQPEKVGGSSGSITDPGGDPDENTMIPVGGNEFYLALMALVYLLIKMKFFNKKTT